MINLMSENVEHLASALSKAQLAIENVSKDKQAYGYKYADLATCLQAVKKPLSDNGLSISQLVTTDSDKHILVTLLMHESGQWLKSTFCIENVVMKQCNSLQQIGAGLTYARRYALSAIVGLTQEDDDAQHMPKNIKDNGTPPLNSALKINIKELVNLCNESRIDIKEFAKVNNIDSGNIESVRDAIMNFEVLKDQFIKQEKINVSTK